MPKFQFSRGFKNIAPHHVVKKIVYCYMRHITATVTSQMYTPNQETVLRTQIKGILTKLYQLVR